MGLLIWAKFFSFSLTKLHPHYKSQLKSGDMGKEAYTLYKDCSLSKIPLWRAGKVCRLSENH